MTGKSRVLGLLALQEKARIAGTLADMSDVIRQRQETEQMLARLNDAMARQGASGGVRLATEVTAERTMTARLLAEVERQNDKATALSERLAEGQARLAAQEHRQAKLSEEAGKARRAEAAERLAGREAAMPPRRR